MTEWRFSDGGKRVEVLNGDRWVDVPVMASPDVTVMAELAAIRRDIAELLRLVRDEP